MGYPSLPKKVCLSGDKALAATHVGQADKLLNIVTGEAKVRGLNMLHKTATLADGTIIVASVLRGQGQVIIVGGGKMIPMSMRFTGCACSQAITFGIVEKVNEASRATGLRYQVLACELKAEAKKDSEPGAEVGVFIATPNKETDQIPCPAPGQTKEQRDAQHTWFHRMILCRTADGAIYKPGDLVPVIPLPFWPGETDGGEVPEVVWDGKDSEEFAAASVRVKGTASAACRIREQGLIPSVYFKNQGTWNALKTKERKEAGIDEPAPWSHDAFIIDPSEENSTPDIINAYTAQYALMVSADRSTGQASVVLADGQVGTNIPTALNADRSSAATVTSCTNAGHVYAAAPAPGGRITDAFDEYLLHENNLAVVMVSHSEKFPSVIVAVGRKWSDQTTYEFPVTHETIGDEWTDGTFRYDGVVVAPGWGPSLRLLEEYLREDYEWPEPLPDTLINDPGAVSFIGDDISVEQDYDFNSTGHVPELGEVLDYVVSGLWVPKTMTYFGLIRYTLTRVTTVELIDFGDYGVQLVDVTTTDLTKIYKTGPEEFVTLTSHNVRIAGTNTSTSNIYGVFDGKEININRGYFIYELHCISFPVQCVAGQDGCVLGRYRSTNNNQRWKIDYNIWLRWLPDEAEQDDFYGPHNFHTLGIDPDNPASGYSIYPYEDPEEPPKPKNKLLTEDIFL